MSDETEYEPREEEELLLANMDQIRATIRQALAEELNPLQPLSQSLEAWMKHVIHVSRVLATTRDGHEPQAE